MRIEAGDVAVITGAGGGIGSGVAKALAEEGCALALVDISQDSLDKLAASFETDQKVSLHVADVTNRDAMKKLAADVIAAHGKVNILMNNAGITLQKNFSTHTMEDWDKIIGINLWGVLYGLHFFDEHLRAADRAHVVNMSSMTAFIGLPAQSSYCLTKAAVEKLSEALWGEWGAVGIGVSHVHPGAIRTDMILATIENSDDVEAARKNYELAMKMGTDRDVAVRKIVGAIKKNKKKVRIGRDAYIFDYISRFFPWLGNLAGKKIAEKHLKDSGGKL